MCAYVISLYFSSQQKVQIYLFIHFKELKTTLRQNLADFQWYIWDVRSTAVSVM